MQFKGKIILLFFVALLIIITTYYFYSKKGSKLIPVTGYLYEPVYYGRVVKLNNLNDKDIKFSFNLEVFLGNGAIKEDDPFTFNIEELKYIKVVDSKGSVVSYKDIKVGQYLTVIQKSRLPDPPHFSINIKMDDM